jgi:hypothetical protein
MTLFEYLAIAFSLVLSFTAMRLIAGLPYAAHPDRRYWVHLVFVCCHLAVTVLVFWNLWSFRAASWTLPTFSLVLVCAGVVYFTACALIPEQASTIGSWRSHYYSVRRRFFLGIVALGLSISLILTVILDLPLLHPARITQFVAISVGTLGAVSSSARVHASMALFACLISAVAGTTVFLEPGAVTE